MAETEVNIRLHIHYKGKQKYYTDPFLKQQKLKLYFFFLINASKQWATVSCSLPEFPVSPFYF